MTDAATATTVVADATPTADPATPAADPAATPAADPVATPAADPATATADPATPAADPAATPAGDEITYAEFTLPDGVAKDNPLLADVTTYAKANKLSQEAAQALVDLGIKQSQNFSDQLKAANDEAVNGWKQQSMADKDIGGEKFEENRATAYKVFETFGTPELKQLLDDSGLGYHPELLRWAVNVGKGMQNDKVVPGGNPPTAKSFYDKSPQLK